MNEYQNPYYQHEASLDSKVSQVMKKVYVKMFLGLLVTAFVSYFCAASPAVLTFFSQHSSLMWVILLVELGLVFAITGAVNRMSSA